MICYTREISLTNEEISVVKDEVSEKIWPGKKEEIKGMLSIEEVLLILQHAYGTECVCNVMLKDTMGKFRLEFNINGSPLDPLSESDEMRYSFSILRKIELYPSYEYNSKKAENVISLIIHKKKKMNLGKWGIFIAMAAAVLTFLIMKFFPQDITTVISENFVAPLFSKSTAIIAQIATPLIFLSVVTGITGIGSSAALGKIGRKLVRNMGISYLVAGGLVAVIAAIIYGVQQTGTNVVSGTIGEVVQLVVDIIPDNMLQSFLTDNDLQVIVVAIFVGIVLLIMGENARKVVNGLEYLSNVVFKMMSIASKILRAIVFLGILNMLMTDFSGITKVYKMVIGWIVGCIFVFCSLFIRLRMVTKVPFGVVFKKALPTLMINLSTSSQVAAMPENLNCCKNKLGISPKIIDFGIPICITAYMPCGAVFLGLLTWSLADLSGIAINLSILIKITIVAVIVAIAAPPIPGSALVVIPIMFSTCNIPMESYSLAMVLGAVLGYFLPALNGFAMQIEMLITGCQLKAVDEKALFGTVSK